MNVKLFAKQAEKAVVDNSPVILTSIGVVGLVSTAVLTGRATIKAQQILLDDADHTKGDVYYQHSFQDRVKMTWPLYIPAVGTGILSCGAIIGANRVSSSRAAGIAAAYSLSEKAFEEYKEKILEKMGVAKEQGARDELAQDRVTKNPASGQQIIIGGGDVLCFEQYSGRYFKSDMESIKKAQNDLNYRILNDNYASLSDFYNLLGLPNTSVSDEVGWNVDRTMEIEFSTCLADDGRPCIAIDFQVVPIRGYYRLH